MFGSKITNFTRRELVTYLKTDECKAMGAFEDLPDEFSLADGEVSWIDKTPPGAKVFFKDEQGRPLVLARKQGHGLCFWLNTGETTEDPPATISAPDTNFLILLRDCISLSF